MGEELSEIRRMARIGIPTVADTGMSTPEFEAGTDAPQFYSPNTLSKWIADNNGATFVATVEKEIVGFVLGYYMEGPRDGYLNTIVVRKGYRGKGAGRELLRAALDYLEKRGCNHVFGLVQEGNRDTLDFLESNGFQIGKTFRYAETVLPQADEK